MNKQKYYWKTAEGKVIDVDDMDINHLKNTLKMIIRNNQTQQNKPLQTKTDCQELEDSLWDCDETYYNHQ